MRLPFRYSFPVLLLLAFISAASSLRADDPPNIVLVISDDQTYAHTSWFANLDPSDEEEPWVQTPEFDSLAAMGVGFTQAYSTFPSCAAARSTILTGRQAFMLEEASSLHGHIPPIYPTLPQLLADAGYAVGFTGKGVDPSDEDVGYNGIGTKNRAGNPGEERNGQTRTPDTSEMSTTDYVANLGKFLDNKTAGVPFYFWVGVREPHRSYEYGSGVSVGGWSAAQGSPDVQVPQIYPDSETIRNDLLDYRLEIEDADQTLAGVIAQLSSRGLLNNTIIIYTGDNGMPFPRSKTQVYDYGVRVPLAIRWDAGIGTTNRTVTDFVGFQDVAPTLLEAAGVDVPETMTGKSFLDVLQSSAAGRVDATRDFHINAAERHGYGSTNQEGYPNRALRTDDFLYIVNYRQDVGADNGGDGPTGSYIASNSALIEPISGERYNKLAWGYRPREELYVMDPASPDYDYWQVVNQADNPKYAEALAEMRGRMEGELRNLGDPRAFGLGDLFTSYPYHKFRVEYNSAYWDPAITVLESAPTTYTTASVGSWTNRFADDFDSTQKAGDAGPGIQSWDVSGLCDIVDSGGDLALRIEGSHTASSNSQTRIVTDDRSIRVIADIKLDGSSTNSGFFISPTGANGYRLNLNQSKSSGDGRVLLRNDTDANNPIEIDPDGLGGATQFDFQSWHRYEIYMTENADGTVEISLSIDGKSVGSVTDSPSFSFFDALEEAYVWKLEPYNFTVGATLTFDNVLLDSRVLGETGSSDFSASVFEQLYFGTSAEGTHIRPGQNFAESAGDFEMTYTVHRYQQMFNVVPEYSYDLTTDFVSTDMAVEAVSHADYLRTMRLSFPANGNDRAFVRFRITMEDDSALIPTP